MNSPRSIAISHLHLIFPRKYAELAHGVNVCDGDYGELQHFGCRPASYIVPNLAALLLKPANEHTALRTQFGTQIARGLADALGMADFSAEEIQRAFTLVDTNGNGQARRRPEAFPMLPYSLFVYWFISF